MKKFSNDRVTRRMGILILVSLGILADCGGRLEPAEAPGPPRVSSLKASGVCPPFPLRDEAGNVIDPARRLNADKPYSPKQTCAAAGCHDYAKVTAGFHFTQGKGEALPAEYASRYNWVTFPGNYGGNWCSPAPLYRQLAPKTNPSARSIDMTSFDFVTATCGNCHPGGGPLEFDRDGRRYDERMRDPASGLVSGADNGFDGDYFRARWSETGVIEADCLLCHMPEYDLKTRNSQLAALNFRWAATAGAGFGGVIGMVSAGDDPVVRYDPSTFDGDGNVLVHIAPEPRNETCLGCHAKPDWKKRGASFAVRTDVHMKAGLRCVDCHTAGSRAEDPRIRGREEHHIGKGDDPSGWVRNDLDGTVRNCEFCHLEGRAGAPRASHDWLAPLHLDKISCQACHVPTRAVKSAAVQASDVFNPAPRISPPPKKIWAFYDQERAFWNHYGDLELFTAKDQPTDVSRPTLVRYKGKIYPANRVHSAWVGFEEDGKPGLNQLFMKDFYQMWMQHRADPGSKFPELSRIADDDGDGMIEVNRPEEIDALLTATRAYLEATGFPLEGRRLVWVSDSRAYRSATDFRDLSRAGHEATAYASVYKFSHDIAPARAALGAGGCPDCHRPGSTFFQGATLDSPFGGPDGRPRWAANAEILGLSSFWVRLGGIRETWIKPALYIFAAALLVFLIAWGFKRVLVLHFRVRSGRSAGAAFVVAALGSLAVFVLALSPKWMDYLLLNRFVLDARHAFFSLFGLILAATAAVLPADSASRSRHRIDAGGRAILAGAGLSVLCGGLMIVKLEAWPGLTRLAYTGFDAVVLATLVLAAIRVAVRIADPAPANRSTPPLPDRL
jgi:hypothetical protein